MNATAKKQGTGLAKFAAPSKVAPTTPASSTSSAAEAAPVATVSERTRGKGETVNLTVRLSRGDWERVHQLAVSEGTSIQKLAVNGLSRIFLEKGLPGL
jgi:hypothetical protein